MGRARQREALWHVALHPYCNCLPTKQMPWQSPIPPDLTNDLLLRGGVRTFAREGFSPPRHCKPQRQIQDMRCCQKLRYGGEGGGLLRAGFACPCPRSRSGPAPTRPFSFGYRLPRNKPPPGVLTPRATASHKDGFKTCVVGKNCDMAERGGFEPPVPVRVHMLSRHAQ